MVAKLRGHFWLVLIALALVVGLAFYWAHSHYRMAAFASAPPTPDGPRVAALRASAKDANLVICVIDAARADHLGCYGYSRDTTPNIDALARKSLKFDEHFCQFPKTKPSTASLFTGQYSDTHLVDNERVYLDGTFTMARGLQAAGFDTALFSSNPNASPGMGIGLDFQEAYDQTQVKPLVKKRWQELTRPEPLLSLFQTWLSKHKGSRFFTYIHIDPPHQPYIQPDEMTALFRGKTPPGFMRGDYRFPVEEKKTVLPYSYAPLQEWINLYDANLRYGDWAVGEVERLLKEAGVSDNTLLIVTADHGEAFGEHGYLWHERGVYDELMHIPLLIRWPRNGAAPRAVNALTQTIDLLPTIFDAFGVRYPRDGVQGHSLLPLISGTTQKVNDYVFARSDGRPPSYLMRSLNYSLTLYGNGKWRELYDLKSDPGQRRDVLDERPTETKGLIEGFRAFARTQRRQPMEFIDPGAKAAPAPASPSAKATGDVKKLLRGLGYVK